MQSEPNRSDQSVHDRPIGEPGPVLRDGPTARGWLIGVITIVLVGAALKATALVTMPLFFAFFITLVVWPVDRFVRDSVPDAFGWLGHIAAMGTVLLAISMFFGGLYFVAQAVAEEMPAYLDDVRQHADRIAQENTEGSLLHMTANRVRSVAGGVDTEDGGSGAFGFISGIAGSLLGSLGTTLSLMTLIFFFTLIMLTELPTWRAKLDAATDGDMRRDWRETIVASSERFRWYLLVRAIVGVITAALYGAWLLLFGVEFVLVWVVLTFLLSFIPTLGSLISGLLPFLFALVTKDIGTALAVGGGLLVVEQVMGNFVDPKLQGRQLSLSPLVILTSLLLWSYLWGLAGALIAVPLTSMLVVAFAHIESLRPIALMLSGSRDYEALDAGVRAGS